MNLTDLDHRESLKLMTLEYSIEEEGNFVSEPIVHCYCRDADGNRREVAVEGFYPFFYITEDEYQKHEHDIFTDSSVREVVAREFATSKDNIYNDSLRELDIAPRTTLDGQNLVKIVTVSPSDVGELRDFFDETWEADVFFTNRFLIESGIKTGMTVPEGVERVHYNEVEATDDPPSVPPRVMTIDIEVWSGNDFPDTQNPYKPVTAVTVHDSYDNEFRAGILHPDSTDVGDEYSWGDVTWNLPDTVDECPVEVYHDEATMLADFNEWIIDKDPDLLTGWNSSRNEIGSGFDYPYWINRCEMVNEWSYRELSPLEQCFVTDGGAPVCSGREMFDMLQAYKKTQIHEKRSYSLGYIAEDELGYGKEDIDDLDRGWTHEPSDFLKYNIRDVEAVVEIEDTKNVLEIYDHIRSITGGTYSEIADSNIGIIDILFLRQAKSKGYALPTSTRPSVQHYWGAYVFSPESGKHRNVVYPDLSSLYPNLFKDMNASPETIVGFEDDLEESKFTKDDCHVVYVDTRDESVKRDANSPERTKLYVLKPAVKESFVRDVISDLIDMKYEYKQDRYADEAYEAIKRITNSVYGVMGDSVSYGKGFRLFDWRIAEAITLAGRDIIKYTADEFEKTVQEAGYDDAKIIAGDTDSCVCKIPSAAGKEETLDIAQMAAAHVDSTYDEFMKERYNISDGNMAVEIESYAEAALFMNKKKRYAQWIRWDEGEDVDEIEVKGFELVRSDSAEITEEVQNEILERILKNDDAKSPVAEYLRSRWNESIDGDVELERIGKPSAINSDLWTYGYSKKSDGRINYYTPQPHIRGARYANEYIDGEEIESGKPLMFYVDGVSPASDYPESYDYENKLAVDDAEMKERDRELDAVAVESVENFPETIYVDHEKMARKTIRDPIEPIVEVMGWDFDDLVAETDQSNLASFM
jgi:DNA polymerase elongation subunit (family B)